MDYDFDSIIRELKPCPFCGGRAEMYSSYQNHGMDGSCRNIVIKCSNCFASMTFAADRFYGREISTPDDMKNRWNRRCKMTDTELKRRKAICEVVNVSDIGDLSDGFHTFNGLYYQRMILFAALVHAYKDRAWKSYRHEDGELCFGGGWFIAGIDTPEGSYTYHYENKDFDRFDCVELPCGKHWDGHTEDDVTRLLSLPTLSPDEVRGVGKWITKENGKVWWYECSCCGTRPLKSRWADEETLSCYCPNCGARMEVTSDALS